MFEIKLLSTLLRMLSRWVSFGEQVGGVAVKRERRHWRQRKLRQKIHLEADQGDVRCEFEMETGIFEV